MPDLFKFSLKLIEEKNMPHNFFFIENMISRSYDIIPYKRMGKFIVNFFYHLTCTNFSFIIIH